VIAALPNSRDLVLRTASGELESTLNGSGSTLSSPVQNVRRHRTTSLSELSVKGGVGSA
jgi:hypothetical protein